MSARLALVRCLLDRGEIGRAVPYLFEAGRNGSAEAWYLLGVCEVRGGNLEQAKEYFENSLRLNPGHVLAKTLLTEHCDTPSRE